MTKKRRILLFCCLLPFVAGFYWLSSKSSTPIVIVGALPAKDLASIKGLIRHEIWKGVFPDFSSKTFKELPGNIRLRFEKRVVRISLAGQDAGMKGPPIDNGNTVRVQVCISKAPPNFWFYDLKRTSAGWFVAKVTGDAMQCKRHS